MIPIAIYSIFVRISVRKAIVNDNDIQTDDLISYAPVRYNVIKLCREIYSSKLSLNLS